MGNPEITRQVGLVHELAHSQGWLMIVNHIERLKEGAMAALLDPSVDPYAAQLARGEIIAYRKVCLLPEQILQAAKGNG